MPFEYCAECQRCCHIDAGYPSLEITLTAAEIKTHHSICIERRCAHLGANGCRLGNQKPFSCQMYPLVYEPHTKRFFYDSECPVMPRYLEQLRIPRSAARRHWRQIQTTIKALRVEDFDFLERNYAIDADYFAIQPVPLPTP
jgi:Fe-S-cluster containining protein